MKTLIDNNFCNHPFQFSRVSTREVKVGNISIGGQNPVRIQTMTTTDTMDTKGTVAQAIRCIEAGAELIRITAPSKRESENLLHIKNTLRNAGYQTPLVADIHFTPNAAEIAAKIVEKVRINPGNYVDKKKFENLIFNNAEYSAEIERIRARFIPLIHICQQYGTALRIGTNHGSLSDRIMSRYGDTPIGMVESAMEFLRIAREENFHQVVLSMKSSNPQVMVHAYRLLSKTMMDEFGERYPLHLGVTEAGDGEDGRIKSAIGIGSLLEDGLGDTIRVSLTEEPELEIPVCKSIIARYSGKNATNNTQKPEIAPTNATGFDPYQYEKLRTAAVANIGGNQVPVVIGDLSKAESISYALLSQIGYTYLPEIDKWNIADIAPDYIFLGGKSLECTVPPSLGVLDFPKNFHNHASELQVLPVYDYTELDKFASLPASIHFIMLECNTQNIVEEKESFLRKIGTMRHAVLCLYSSQSDAPCQAIRKMRSNLQQLDLHNPIVIMVDSAAKEVETQLIQFSIEAGYQFIDGFGDGITLGVSHEAYRATKDLKAEGRNYLQNVSIEQMLNATAFGILQAARTRISKTEYISCPSCGRTLFELQETTEKIRKVTNHLKGLKIAIMGCIVNGPGEMADADFGYVGSGPGKITLYKGKEIMKRNVDSAIAVDALIDLLKEHAAWIEPAKSSSVTQKVS